MYFDVKATNLQEILDVLPISHDVVVTMLQNVQKHVP